MTNDKALDAFLEKRNEFDKLIARLAALSEDHFFGAEPEEINWGHVGTLTEWTALLRRVADAAFGEGGHTEPKAAMARLGEGKGRSREEGVRMRISPRRRVT